MGHGIRPTVYLGLTSLRGFRYRLDFRKPRSAAGAQATPAMGFPYLLLFPKVLVVRPELKRPPQWVFESRPAFRAASIVSRTP